VDGRLWKVGELAEATGVTVRTLHHFDAIGLLRPTRRSAAGHRLYTESDVRRLYRVLALRRLGLPLDDIARSLDADGDGDDLAGVVHRQLTHVEQQLTTLRDLRRRLRGVAGGLAQARDPSADQLIEIMEASMSYFTPDELARVRARHAEPGFAEAFARWQDRCAEIARELAAHVAAGTAPADPAVQELAWQWRGAMREMTGDDPGVLSSTYRRIEAKGPEAATRGILTAEVWDYLKLAFAVGFGTPRRH